MNIFSIVGFVLAFGILFAGLYLASPQLGMFWDWPSMFIVAGGSFAATAISFQLNRIVILFKIFFLRVIKGQRYDYQKLAKELVILSDRAKKGEDLSALSQSSNDFFIKESFTLLQDGVIPENEVIQILTQRNENIFMYHMQESSKMKTVGKFPPAFGMIGTTIGMIVLLANLGGEDAMKMIGPAMAVALITTLYGAIFANMIFIPIGENLVESSKETFQKNLIIIEAVSLMAMKANPILVTERLNSYLPPAQRLNWKEVLGK